MEAAPFFSDVAEGPGDVSAHWLRAEDGLRLRIATWPGGRKGTVLLFPGRTEFVEKYARTAAALLARGYSTVAVDWRGQGLADRVTANRRTGHVGSFDDYQKDAAALVDALAGLPVAPPYHLLGHSMGGAIGLRFLLQGGPVKSAAFSAPMWGIELNAAARTAARLLPAAAVALGQGAKPVIGGSGDTCLVASTRFEDNNLTHDRDTYAYMQRQVLSYPDLALGAPSYQWLRLALSECAQIVAAPAPDLPALTFLGDQETIVAAAPVHARMANWPRGELLTLPGAKHEILMETPEIRDKVLDQITALFDAQG